MPAGSPSPTGRCEARSPEHEGRAGATWFKAALIHFGEKGGTCSEAYPTVLRAEFRALKEVLGVANGELIIYVDDLEVVDGIGLGRQWCCFPKRDGADERRQIWNY